MVKVDFGVIDHVDLQDIPISQTFDERMEQIEQFDRDGFDAFHITEHHFTPHGIASSPIVFLAAAARLTRNIKLIPTVFVLPTYHPLRLAEELCMLDQLAHGRIEYGTGRGIQPYELALFGLPPFEAPDIAKECQEILQLALESTEVSYRGQYYKFFNVPMKLRPYASFANRGAWITSANPATLRTAGEKGDNTLTTLGPDRVRPLIEAYMEGWTATHKSDEPLPKLGITRHVYVTENQEEAIKRGEIAFGRWFDNHSWIPNRFDRSRGRGDDSAYRQNRNLVFGTPDAVRKELEAQVEESGGANYVVPRFAFGDLTQNEVMRSYKLFRDEVMPHMAKRKIHADAAE